MLLATFFLFSVRALADDSLDITYDYKAQLKAYVADGYYPDMWVSDCNFVGTYYMTDIFGNHRYTKLGGLENYNWCFFEVRLYGLSERALSSAQLQLSGDFTFTGVDLGYLLIYDTNAQDVSDKPVKSQAINVKDGVTYSLDTIFKTSEGGTSGYSVVFAVRNENSAQSVTISWDALNLQSYAYEDDATGFNLLNYVKNIWNGIKSLPSNIANSIKGFFDNVVSAVVNIGVDIVGAVVDSFNDFTTWLHDLVYPKSSDFLDFYNRVDKFLTDKLGFIYESQQLFFDMIDLLSNATPDDTLIFPAITVGDYGIVCPAMEIHIMENPLVVKIMDYPGVRGFFNFCFLMPCILWCARLLSHSIFGLLHYGDVQKADDSVDSSIDDFLSGGGFSA